MHGKHKLFSRISTNQSTVMFYSAKNLFHEVQRHIIKSKLSQTGQRECHGKRSKFRFESMWCKQVHKLKIHISKDNSSLQLLMTSLIAEFNVKAKEL